jgi:hypothetical protein
MRLALLCLVCLAGCATLKPDVQLNCLTAREDPERVEHASLRELKRLAYGTPAQAQADSAYGNGVTTIVMRAVGAGALVAGLVTGFATNPGTQAEARIAGYSLAGGAVGVLALSFAFDYLSGRASRQARVTLRQWGQSCAGQATPAP